MNDQLYKKFVIRFFGIMVCLLLAMMLFNYFVDPGNQFAHSALIEHNIATKLLANKKVIVQANYNERLLQKIMIQNMTVSPDVFVLGSSHIMALTHDSFGTKRFFNAAVSSASLQDDIALYYLLQKKGFQPKTVVICLDPWIISKSNPEMLWKTEYISAYHNGVQLILQKKAASDYFIRITSFFEKYSQLLSSDYLIASINKFVLLLHHDNALQQPPSIKVFSSTVDVCRNCFVRLPDGARLPTPAEEATTSIEANQYVMNNVNSWNSFWSRSEIDLEYTLIFEAFVQYLIKQHVNVVFYFPALEPLEYSQLVEKNEKYKMVLIAQKYFDGMAKKYNVYVVGSYNPSLAHINTNDFIDSWHLKEEGLQKLFKKRNK